MTWREELAWAAGFFDGEGSIILARGATTFMLQVGQADRRPLDRFHSTVLGLGYIEGPFAPRPGGLGRRPMYRWRVGKWRHAQAVLAMLWPSLSEPKRERALVIMRDFNERIGPTLRVTCPHAGKRSTCRDCQRRPYVALRLPCSTPGCTGWHGRGSNVCRSCAARAWQAS